MTAPIPLALQTAYADLLERCAAADEASSAAGAYLSKLVRGRRYWYFQDATRRQRYLGPETPELADRIARHKQERSAQRDRRAVVSMLVRSARLPRPSAEIGDALGALARAGVFRRSGVLVGTVAYQTYAAMLGQRLGGAALQTADIDISGPVRVSAADAGDIPSMLDVLRTADASFRPVPHRRSRRRVASYQSALGVRVDFLVPNAGRDTDAAAPLPGFGTDAQPLRFLDFLIRDPEPAVVLHGEGVYVLVPAPARFAVHKLIVARRRPQGAAKRDKDILQADSLLSILARRRPHELRAALHESCARGRRWRQLLAESLDLLDPAVRELALNAAA